jgi:hypothetical protein
MIYFFTPTTRELANDCEFCYQRDCIDLAHAERIAVAIDAKVRDAAFVEELQKCMHLAEGCSHPNCAAGRDYDPTEEDCGFAVEHAEDWADPLQICYEDASAWCGSCSLAEYSVKNADIPEEIDSAGDGENHIVLWRFSDGLEVISTNGGLVWEYDDGFEELKTEIMTVNS